MSSHYLICKQHCWSEQSEEVVFPAPLTAASRVTVFLIKVNAVSNSTAAAFDPIDQWQLISECSSQRLWKIIVSLPVLTTIGASWPTVGLDSAVCDSGQILLFQCFICLPTRRGNVFASWGILSTQLAFGTSISYILKAALFPSCWGCF